MMEDFDYVRKNCPLLMTFLNGEMFGKPLRVKPQDMDAFAVETTKVYQRCVFSVTIHEDILLRSIFMFDNKLEQESESSAEKGALLVLFRRLILTPVNVSSLLRMCDPKKQTSRVIAHALWHLDLLATTMRSIWSIQLNDDESFAFALIRTMATLLDPAVSGECVDESQEFVPWKLVATGLNMHSDSPKKVVDLLLTFPWSDILQREDAPVLDHHGDSHCRFLEMLLFFQLHETVVELVQNETTHRKAKNLLKQMGSSSDLLIRVLKRIVSGDYWSPDQTRRPEECDDAICFLLGFFNCLVPLPIDEELDVVFQEARCCLLEKLPASAEATRHIQFFLGDQAWQQMKHETDAARWERFDYFYPAYSCDGTSKEDTARKLKRAAKGSLMNSVDLSEGEMCANCFTLEAKLQSGTKLKKCKRCLQVKYCSR